MMKFLALIFLSLQLFCLTVKAEVPQAENEIPLALEKVDAAKAAGGGAMQIALTVIGIVLVGVGSFYGLRRFTKPNQRKSGPQIKVINQHWLGPKKSLAVVSISGESMLIGVTDHHISLIKSLSLLDEDLQEDAAPVIKDKFSQVIRQKEQAKNPRTFEEKEEFSFQGLQDGIRKKILDRN